MKFCECNVDSKQNLIFNQNLHDIISLIIFSFTDPCDHLLNLMYCSYYLSLKIHL